MKRLTEIILNGCFGRMGREVSRTVKARNDSTVVAGVDIVKGECACYDVFERLEDITCDADVVIDFSSNAALSSLLDFGLRRKTPLVLCTTGYSSEHIERIKEASQYIPILYSRNMSIGINLLIELSKIATKVFGKYADINIIEKHHAQKKDSPSGTALMLRDAINSVSDQNVLIESVRAGTIVGEHEVMFAGQNEIITLSHFAGSKEIFALGAVNAANFIIEQENGLYDMSSLVYQNG